MRGTQDTLLLPVRDGTIGTLTPSGLTPNTRSEAEAALSHNTFTQTDSAAPSGTVEEYITEAQKAYRRPANLDRTSSTNYETALREAHDQASASSSLSPTTSNDTSTPSAITDGMKVISPVSSTIPAELFPLPGQGVVPRHASIGSGQAEIVRKAKPSGLSLGDLGRQQSWSSQDMKHVRQGDLMNSEAGKSNAGYGSGQG